MGEPELREAVVLARDETNVSRFAAKISSDWTIVHVFGGVAMYVALRAMRELLDEPAFTPLTATALFLTPVPAGPVTVDVDRLRVGRNTAQLASSLRPHGQTEPALHVDAVFGATRASDLAFQNVRAPIVPPPHEVAARRHSPDVHFNFDDRTEWRPISGIEDPRRDRVLAGSTSAVLVISTDATQFTVGNASIIDGGTATVAAFQPTAIPEPSSALLVCAGIFSAVGLRRRYNRQ